MLTTTLETITPEIARDWLSRNLPENRKIHQDTVNRYAADMTNGEFRICNTAIAFDENGNLIDGQHRLLACVKSGVPFQSFVTRGMAASSYKVIDIGHPRNAGVALKYEHNNDVIYYSSDIIALVRLMCRCIPDSTGNIRMRPSVADIESIVSANYSLFVNAHAFSMWCARKIPAAAILGSLAAHINGVRVEDIRSFNNAAFANTIDTNKDPATTRLALEMRKTFDPTSLSHSAYSSAQVIAIYQSYLKAYLDGKLRRPKLSICYPIHFDNRVIVPGEAVINGVKCAYTSDMVLA